MAAILFLISPLKNIRALTITGNIKENKTQRQVEEYAREVAVAGGGLFANCLPDTVTVMIANTNEDFQRLTSGRLPEWGIGAADLSRMRIIIKNPSRFSYGQSFGEVVRHEFAHIYLQSCCSGCRWPRWFQEGCAMLFSGEWRVGRDITVGRAAAFSHLPSLKELENVNSFSQAKASLAYSMSFLAVRHFIDQFGRQGLIELFANMRAGQLFPTAFYNTTGMSYDKWDNDFRNYLKRRYFFIFWFGDFPVFWVSMVLFFVVIYILKRRQMKRKTDKWEKDENYDYFDYGPPPD